MDEESQNKLILTILLGSLGLIAGFYFLGPLLSHGGSGIVENLAAVGGG